MAKIDQDWSELRSQFLTDPDHIYLNTGSWGMMPRPVFDAYIANLRELELNPTLSRKLLINKVNQARDRLSSFLNIQAEDMSFLPNVTAAINVVVNGFDWEPGDQILTTDQEYGAILNCLHNASRRWGVEIVTAEVPMTPTGPSDIVDSMRARFSDCTRLVVCSHITTRTGIITPIKAITELAHEHGALVAFDGAHGPGMIPLDITDSGADFYGGNCHKWLCSPKGVGFLYADPTVQAKLSHLVVSWGYSRNGYTVGPDRPEINGAPFMRGSETWGTMDLSAQAAVREAIDFQERIGQESIAERGRELSGYLRAQIANIPWADVVSPSTEGMYGSITTCGFEGVGNRELQARLNNEDGITIPVFEDREGCEVQIRVSTHYYNTTEEIEYLLECVSRAR